MATVMDYRTGAQLDGIASEKLIAESAAERSGTGAVGAVLEDGVWQYVPDSECKARGAITVWVEP